MRIGDLQPIVVRRYRCYKHQRLLAAREEGVKPRLLRMHLRSAQRLLLVKHPPPPIVQVYGKPDTRLPSNWQRLPAVR